MHSFIRHCFIAFVISYLFLSAGWRNCIFAQQKNDAAAASLQHYFTRRDTLSTADQLAAIERILHKHNRFAAGHAEHARLLISTGTLSDRYAAVEAIERAILLQPDEASYHYLAGTIHLQRDQYAHRTRLARHSFERTLSLEQTHGEASYQLGLLAEEAFLEKRYQANSHEDWTITFSQFAEKDVEKAQDYFADAANWLVQPAKAYSRLALLAFERDNFKEMQAMLTKALDADSTQSDAWLWQAYLSYQSGSPGIAKQAFQTALRHLPDTLRTQMLSMATLASPAKIERVAAANSEQDWYRHDPLFLTALNERLLEHCVRFAYARLRFGSMQPTNDGQSSDPGKTLIRFGFPKSINGTQGLLQKEGEDISGPTTLFTPAFTPKGKRLGGLDSRRKLTFRSSQLVWQYDTFAIPFDRNMSGSNTFAWGVEKSDGRDIFNRILKKTPTLFTAKWPERTTAIASKKYQFKSENGQTEIFIFVDFADSSSHDTWANPACEVGLFVLDTLFRPISQIIQKQSLPAALTIGLLPGEYTFGLEVLDSLNARVGIERQRTEAHSFSGANLQLSDLVIAKEMHRNLQANNVTIKGFAITPAFNNQFRIGARLHLLFEIYQLAQRDGTSRYRLEISLRQSGSERTAASFDFQAEAKRALVAETVELTGVDEGIVELLVRVTDLYSGRSAEAAEALNMIK